MLPYTRVRIVGPSMEPALRNGDWVLVRRTGRLRTGDIALLAHPRRPDLLVVKRAARPEGTGWWVLGDNPDSSDDSREFGVVPSASIVGRVTFRYWRPGGRD
ncbi:MAG: nickel-type superoxide dismutase maturation protease [Actinomycetota bacterium]|nr:nickel-type superoxide dismutase maturation protease [Actinomycetota bacterium]